MLIMLFKKHLLLLLSMLKTIAPFNICVKTMIHFFFFLQDSIIMNINFKRTAIEIEIFYNIVKVFEITILDGQTFYIIFPVFLHHL